MTGFFFERLFAAKPQELSWGESMWTARDLLEVRAREEAARQELLWPILELYGARRVERATEAP